MDPAGELLALEAERRLHVDETCRAFERQVTDAALQVLALALIYDGNLPGVAVEIARSLRDFADQLERWPQT
jgi:hypothetical protein